MVTRQFTLRIVMKTYERRHIACRNGCSTQDIMKIPRNLCPESTFRGNIFAHTGDIKMRELREDVTYMFIKRHLIVCINHHGKMVQTKTYLTARRIIKSIIQLLCLA